jgi:hypothetical protein
MQGKKTLTTPCDDRIQNDRKIEAIETQHEK